MHKLVFDEKSSVNQWIDHDMHLVAQVFIPPPATNFQMAPKHGVYENKDP